MTVDAALDKVDNFKLSESEQLELAAQILNQIDPSDANLTKFMDELDDNVHDELINRAGDRENRN